MGGGGLKAGKNIIHTGLTTEHSSGCGRDLQLQGKGGKIIF